MPGRPNSLLKAAAAERPVDHDVERARRCAPACRSRSSQGWTKPGMRRFETEKPVRPALGLPPRPVARFVADLTAGAGGGAGVG